MADEEQVAILRQGVEVWNRWRKENQYFMIDFCCANLNNANLSNANLGNATLWGASLHKADLRKANLCKADLRKADLRGANLIDVNLSHANLREVRIDEDTHLDKKWQLVWAILNPDQAIVIRSLNDIDLSETDLVRADLRDFDMMFANLSETNLHEADLVCTNFINANLSNIDLSYARLVYASLCEANLCGANLRGVQATNSNFEGANLTGACIASWNINSQTNLDNIVCEYIYLGYNPRDGYTDRRPSDPAQIFAPGDFARLVQKAQETVDLIFRNGIDWQAFSNAFQTLKADRVKVEGSDRTFSVRAIENLDDGSFVVRINTPKDTDKGAIERTFQAQYEAELKQLETAYREKLQGQEREIELYREQLQYTRQQNTDLTDIMKLLAARDSRTIHITGNEIKGTGYAEDLNGSGCTEGNTQTNLSSQSKASDR